MCVSVWSRQASELRHVGLEAGEVTRRLDPHDAGLPSARRHSGRQREGGFHHAFVRSGSRTALERHGNGPLPCVKKTGGVLAGYPSWGWLN